MENLPNANSDNDVCEISENEIARLSVLKQYDSLDLPSDLSLNLVTNLAARLIGVPIAIISLVDSERIWFRSHFGIDLTDVPRTPGLCASAILSDKPRIVRDASCEPSMQTNPLVAGEVGLRFYAAVPLRTADGYNLGTLCVIDRQPREISEAEIQLLKNLAELVMNEMDLRMAVRRASHFERMLLSKQQLLETSRSYEVHEKISPYVTDLVTMDYSDADLHDDVMMQSPDYDGCFGYAEGVRQWRYEVFIAHIHPDDRMRFRKQYRSARAICGSYEVEFRVKWPDQSIHWLLSKGKFHFDDNSKAIRVSSVYIETTARKEYEEKIERLGSVIEKTATPVMITDADGRIVWVNTAFNTLTGYSMDEIVGKAPSEFLHGPETSLATRKTISDAIKNQRGFEAEILNYKKSGQQFWQYIKADPVRDNTGKVASYVAIQSDITERKKFEMKLWEKANFDQLTGLPNRHLFLDRLEHEVKHGSRLSKQVALFSINLDYFSKINDLFSHKIGDKLLKDVADRIVACVRKTDTVARTGGDEFTVILAALDEMSDTEIVAKKILTELSKPFVLEHAVVNLSASIGIALYPTHGTKSEVLLKHADHAMHASKSCGRNQFNFFTKTTQEKSQRRLYLGVDLRSALFHNELEIRFQPIISLSTGSVVKAEALLRWNHQEKGCIEPSEFIPIAEESGLINEIGEWVFYEAASLANKWSKKRNASFQISVNKSAVQFELRSEERSWPKQLKSMGLPCNQTCIEITEGILLRDSKHLIETLDEYREAGIEIALDDFGTGYSSMSYLSRFNIDYIKIDKCFVQNATSFNGRTIIETIITMGHKLGIKIIAEGIETHEQQRILVDAGCDFGQGLLYSDALLRNEFEKFYIL